MELWEAAGRTLSQSACGTTKHHRQYPFMRPCHRCATVAGKTATFFNENFTPHSLERLSHHSALLRAFTLVVRTEKIMKHALIGSLSVLAMIAGTAAAYAQADINPNIYPSYRGAAVAQQPSEWYATPGPVRRGNMCTVDVDAGRGYGYMKPCPAPQAAPRVAHRAHRKTVVR
jgi:hypothetical protein